MGFLWRDEPKGKELLYITFPKGTVLSPALRGINSPKFFGTFKKHYFQALKFQMVWAFCDRRRSKCWRKLVYWSLSFYHQFSSGIVWETILIYFFFWLIAKGLNAIFESRLAQLRVILVKDNLVSRCADCRDPSLAVFSFLYEIVFSFSSIQAISMS